jgi:anti-anti-sigma factor
MPMPPDTAASEDGAIRDWGALRVSACRPDPDSEVIVLTVAGELDLYASPGLREALEAFGPGDCLAVDLRGVSFIDSTGMGALVATHRKVRDGLTLVITRGSQVERALDAVHLLPSVAALHLGAEVDAAGIAAEVRARRACR